MGSDGHDRKEIKKRKFDQEEEQQQHQSSCCLDSLPHELALDIISRLPIKSLIQSRFVCKFWQELSYDPHLVPLHLSNALKSSNPCFIVHCDFPIKNQLFFVEFSGHDDPADNKVRKMDAPPFSASVPEFNVIGSCNGILCLANSLFDQGLYLYNPFTRDYIQLPTSTVFQDELAIYGFGFHPITREYKLIKIVYYPSTLNVNAIGPSRRFLRDRNLKSDVQIFSLGSKKWRSIGNLPYRLEGKSVAVLLHGRLHWTTNYGSYNGQLDRLIVSFDISDEVFRVVPGPDLSNRANRRSYHLAVLGECLCVVVPVPAHRGTLDVWIMKAYGEKESWVKEISIGVYNPSSRTRELRKSFEIWKNVLCGKVVVRVLCVLKDGQVLLEYRGGTLFAYNPETGMFRNVTFEGMPYPSRTIVHVGSLNRVGAPS